MPEFVYNGQNDVEHMVGIEEDIICVPGQLES